MLRNLTCNSCGAPLEVPEEANFVTCNHCSSQLAVRHTGDVTFTEQLDQLAAKTEELSDRLEDLSSQQELEAQDREGSLKLEAFMISGNNAIRHIPTEAGSVGGGIAIALFGGLWTAMAVAITSSAPPIGPFAIAKVAFPLFGIIFIVVGVIRSVAGFAKAGEYRRAEQQYQERREKLLRDTTVSRT